MASVQVDAVSVVGRFNDCINARDLDGLAGLMHIDHKFIDSAGSVVAGKQACLEAWQGFFASFPDYRNVIKSMTPHGDEVTMVGYSACAEPALAGPAIWTAMIRDGQVAQWRVDEDTPTVR